MALRKRGRIWWVDIHAPNGARIRRSTGTEDNRLAQEYHDHLKVDLWRIHKLGDKPRRTWQEAAVKWCKVKKNKKDINKDIAKLKWFDDFIGDAYLDEITYQRVEFIADAKESEGVEGATVNRYLALLRSILRKAMLEWEWIDKVPKMPMRTEPEGRIRWLTVAEVDRLLAALPEYYALPAAFSLATGPRQRNVLNLRWSQIDLERRVAWLNPGETKNGAGLSIPLNDDALAVLARCQGQHPEFVFTKDGARIKEIDNRSWKAALAVAKIDDFRWHDLRHTWASRHIQNRTSLAELKELGGWKTDRMVLRYAHLCSDQKQKAAQNIDGTVSLPGAEPRPVRHRVPHLRVVK